MFDSTKFYPNDCYVSNSNFSYCNSSQGVQILNVIIKSVKLPMNIQKQMSQEIQDIHTREEESIQHIHEMQHIRMEEEMRGLLQSYDEIKKQETQITLAEINGEKGRLEDSIALAKKAEAEISEDSRVQIESMQEKHAYEIQKIKDAMVSKLIDADKQFLYVTLFVHHII